MVTKVAKTVFGSQLEVTLTPQFDDAIEENKRFAKATPSGTIQIYVDNPPAEQSLALGKLFYVDFTGGFLAEAMPGKTSPPFTREICTGFLCADGSVPTAQS